MAFDGIFTYAVARELNDKIAGGKIEKVYQPGPDALLIHIHTPEENRRLFISCGSAAARICFTEAKYENPADAPAFCMLMRKHIQTGRITEVRQRGSDRIVEIDIEAQSELGFTVSKRLIVEIMGKHSNIVLVNTDNGKIIDSIKRISIDMNRYRQLLPGAQYKYPPAQDKIPFRDVKSGDALRRDPKMLLATIGGISPAIARELAASPDPAAALEKIVRNVEAGIITPSVYSDEGELREFHVTDLSEYTALERLTFDSPSECAEYFFSHREASNHLRQKAAPLIKITRAASDKARLKIQRLSEDLLRAENSDKYRLYGELLTANIHLIKPGESSVTLTSYYDGKPVEIALDKKLSAAKNAQRYFKKYAKAKTAIKEKKIQLEETRDDVKYLDSVMHSLEAARSETELERIAEELSEGGYMRSKTVSRKSKKQKPSYLTYTLSDGSTVLVGRNNKENDFITMKRASKTDIWFHTKDIPGSHVILLTGEWRSAADVPENILYEAASIAAYHSKASKSENVPVDFVPVRHVKKPNGAKPGMVIFTHNTTIYVKPGLPKGAES